MSGLFVAALIHVASSEPLFANQNGRELDSIPDLGALAAVCGRAPRRSGVCCLRQRAAQHFIEVRLARPCECRISLASRQ